MEPTLTVKILDLVKVNYLLPNSWLGLPQGWYFSNSSKSGRRHFNLTLYTNLNKVSTQNIFLFQSNKTEHDLYYWYVKFEGAVKSAVTLRRQYHFGRRPSLWWIVASCWDSGYWTLHPGLLLHTSRTSWQRTIALLEPDVHERHILKFHSYILNN